MLLVSHRASKM